MDNTTTSEDGVQSTQPTTNGAVEASLDGSEQIIANDDNGTPSSEPLSQAQEEGASEAVSEEPQAKESEETQAKADVESVDEDILEWTEKKGLKIDPKNPNEVKLAQMQRDAERAMHKANQLKSAVQPPELLEPSEDVNYNAVIERQNTLELKTYVRDWFEANPEMKEYREDLQRIANERPYLNNMDDLRAHFLADPSRLESLKKEGGRSALKNLAQKQQQQPPTSSATNANAFSNSNKITAQNVDAMVAKMTPEEYAKRLPEINAVL